MLCIYICIYYYMPEESALCGALCRPYAPLCGRFRARLPLYYPPALPTQEKTSVLFEARTRKTMISLFLLLPPQPF